MQIPMLRRLSPAALALSVMASAIAQAPPDGPGGPDGPDGGFPDGPPMFGPPGGGRMGPGGPMAEDRPILKQFDKDRNGRLEGAERDAAREELKKNPSRGPFGGRGGMRGPGGPGGPDGPGGARAETKPGPKVSPADVRNYPDAPLYAQDIVRTVFIDFDLPNWEEELELFHGTDADVPAKMTVDGKSIDGVGVHFRGASSYMMVPRGTKRSLNISIDHTDPKARLYGQTTLNLLNANGDASMMSSVLYSHLASKHLPTPQANFVQVVVNGESWGVFVSVEQFNRTFLREHWADFKGEGARWKVRGSPMATGGLDYRGDDLKPYRERYEIKTKDEAKDWKSLVRLCKTLSETPIDQLEAKLSPMLDIEGVLWFLAMDMATANSDGYWTRASDYSLYLDPKGVFHVVPHDMNEAFMGSHGGPGGPGGPGGFGRGRGMRPQAPEGDAGERPRSSPGAVGQDGARPPQDANNPDGERPQRRGPGGGRGMMGGGGSMFELDPLVGMDDATKPLRSRLLAVPALRARYLDHLKAIAAEMDWAGTTGALVAKYRALIGELAHQDTRKAFPSDEFDRATAPEGNGGLREFFERRSKYLLGYTPREQTPARPAK